MRQRNRLESEEQIVRLQSAIKDTQKLIRTYRNYKRYKGGSGDEYREDFLVITGYLGKVETTFPERLTARQDKRGMINAVSYFVKRTGFLSIEPDYILPNQMGAGELNELLEELRDEFEEEEIDIRDRDKNATVGLVWRACIINVLRDGETNLWNEALNIKNLSAAQKDELVDRANIVVTEFLTNEFGDRVVSSNKRKISRSIEDLIIGAK